MAHPNIADPYLVEARLHVLEVMVSHLCGLQFFSQYGAQYSEELKKQRLQLWDLMTGMDLNALPPEEAKKLEAQVRNSLDRFYKLMEISIDSALKQRGIEG